MTVGQTGFAAPITAEIDTPDPTPSDGRVPQDSLPEMILPSVFADENDANAVSFEAGSQVTQTPWQLSAPADGKENGTQTAESLANSFRVDHTFTLTDVNPNNPGVPTNDTGFEYGQANANALIVSLTETIAEDFVVPGGNPAGGQTVGQVAPATPDIADVEIFVTGEAVAFDDTLLSPELTLSGPLVSIDDFRGDPSFAGIDGSGFAVVILDTGIDLDHPHFGPDLDRDGVSDRIVYQYDFADGDSSAAAANSGHGTNVTGIALSSDSTYTGIAPGADIIHLKVFEDSGTGYFSYVEDALRWVAANAAAYNIASVNLSMSDFDNHSTPQEIYGVADEMALLAAQNVVVVSSSGNSFAGFNSVQGVSYPSADPNSLSVGAVFDTDNENGWTYGSAGTAFSAVAGQITPFSQRDDELTDIFAPGAPITAAGLHGGLSTLHGTSMAAPHIAGIVALAQQLAVQELDRMLTVTEFTELMVSTGQTINDGDDENDNVINTGLDFPLVDVVALGQAIQALAPPPVLSISPLDAVQLEGNDGTTTFTFTVTRTGGTHKAVTVDFDVEGSGSEPAPFSGNLAHHSTIQSGFHTHYFYGATYPWAIFAGETLFTQIYLDPLNVPNEIMLQWGAQDGWGHRAYWGSDNIGGGVNGTESRYYMGELPEAGEWVRLEVPAALVGLENSDLTGMAFTLHGGRASWDYTGVNDGFSDIVWVDDELPEGAIGGGLFDTWDFTGGNSANAADFGGTLPSGTLTFAPGETTKTITLEIAGDDAIEADEDFIITLSNATDGVEIAEATASATIQDDDDTPPLLSIAAADAIKPEGGDEQTSLSFEITRSGNTDKAVDVDFTVSGNGTAPEPYSGELAHQSSVVDGFHTHYFYGTEHSWSVFSGETLFTYIYLDPINTPSEIMLQWGAKDGWEHRAYWGNNDIDVGIEGTESLLHMGDLPEAGKWVRLEVPADAVGLGNADLNGMFFSLFGGRATWDYTGVNDGFSDIVWVDDELPEGAIAGGLFEAWEFTSGTSADADDFGGTYPSGTVSFAPGETSKIITIDISGDTTVETDEEFLITLSNATGTAEIIDATATGTIQNDDVQPAPVEEPAADEILPEEILIDEDLLVFSSDEHAENNDGADEDIYLAALDDSGDATDKAQEVRSDVLTQFEDGSSADILGVAPDQAETENSLI